MIRTIVAVCLVFVYSAGPFAQEYNDARSLDRMRQRLAADPLVIPSMTGRLAYRPAPAVQDDDEEGGTNWGLVGTGIVMFVTGLIVTGAGVIAKDDPTHPFHGDATQNIGIGLAAAIAGGTAIIIGTN